MNDQTTRKKNQQQKQLLTKMTIWAVNSTANQTSICSLWAITLQYLNYITTTTVDNSKNKVDEGNQLKMQRNRQSKICQLKNQIREQNLLTAQKTKLDSWKFKKTTFYNVVPLQQAAAKVM